MLLEREPPDDYSITPKAKQPFIPTGAINGAPAKGISYGTRLQLMTYSDTLTDLIQEMLYEIPAHRPTVLEVKNRTLAVIAATRGTLMGQLDNWADLEKPGPATI